MLLVTETNWNEAGDFFSAIEGRVMLILYRLFYITLFTNFDYGVDNLLYPLFYMECNYKSMPKVKVE